MSRYILIVSLAALHATTAHAVLSADEREFCGGLRKYNDAKSFTQKDIAWSNLRAQYPRMKPNLRYKVVNTGSETSPFLAFELELVGSDGKTRHPVRGARIDGGNVADGKVSLMVALLKAYQTELGVTEPLTGDKLAEELAKQAGFNAQTLQQLRDGDKVDARVLTEPTKERLQDELRALIQDKLIKPELKKCGIGSGASGSSAGAAAGSPRRPSVATSSQRADASIVCANLIKVLADSASGKVRKESIAAQWEVIHGRDPSLKASYKYNIDASNPRDMKVEILLENPGGPPIPLKSTRGNTSTAFSNAARIKMISAFGREFAKEASDWSGKKIAEDLAGKNVPKEILDEIAAADSAPMDLQPRIREEAHQAAYQAIYEPRKKQCEDKLLPSAAGDELARDALAGRNGASVKQCRWDPNSFPKALVTGCGTFCSGSAWCVYVKDGEAKPEVGRVIGCRPVPSSNGVIDCGDATRCHKDKVAFKFANTEEGSAPAGGAPSGAADAR